jgi:hypothetical protein
MRILLLILCVSQLSFKTLDAPREVLEYVENFRSFAQTQQILPELQARVNTTRFEMTDLILINSQPSSLDGLCYYEHNTILIGKIFSQFTKEEKQDLIDHEMGHCVLGRVHSFKFEEMTVQKNNFKPMCFYFDQTPSSRMFPQTSASAKSNLADQGKMGYAQKILFKRTHQILETTKNEQIANDLATRQTLEKVANRD